MADDWEDVKPKGAAVADQWEDVAPPAKPAPTFSQTVDRYSGLEGLRKPLDWASNRLGSSIEASDQANLSRAARTGQTPSRFTGLGSRMAKSAVDMGRGLLTPSGATQAAATVAAPEIMAPVLAAQGLYGTAKGATDIATRGATPENVESTLSSASALAGGTAGTLGATVPGLRKVPRAIAEKVYDPKTGKIQTPYELAIKTVLPDPYSPNATPARSIPKGTNYGQFLENQKATTKAGLRAAPEPPANAGPAAPTGQVVKLPIPREPLPGENPNYMASIPRERLTNLGRQGRPGAGEQLRNTGKTVLYLPEEYPGPRPSGNEPQGLRPNASGESSASQEAINRSGSEARMGAQRVRVDTRSGKEMPLIGVDAVDAKAGPYDRIEMRDANGNVTTLDEGTRALPRKLAKPEALRPSKPRLGGS